MISFVALEVFDVMCIELRAWKQICSLFPGTESPERRGDQWMSEMLRLCKTGGPLSLEQDRLQTYHVGAIRHSQSFDAFTVSQLAEIDDFVFGNLDRYKDEA